MCFFVFFLGWASSFLLLRFQIFNQIISSLLFTFSSPQKICEVNGLMKGGIKCEGSFPQNYRGFFFLSLSLFNFHLSFSLLLSLFSRGTDLRGMKQIELVWTRLYSGSFSVSRKRAESRKLTYVPSDHCCSACVCVWGVCVVLFTSRALFTPLLDYILLSRALVYKTFTPL